MAWSWSRQGARARGGRSPVLARNGMVASSQPLACMAGIAMLQRGGNAADAAVAVAAALNVVEPMSTGIGGDCFCLFYEAARKAVHALNGSGRAPAALTLARVREAGIAGDAIPPNSVHAVTVPGAVAGWLDTVERFGRLPMSEVLAPAIRVAVDGFPVSPVIAAVWAEGAEVLRAAGHTGDLLPGGGPPAPGDLVRNPDLARVMAGIAEQGTAGFYEGEPAEAIVEAVRGRGGLLTLEDLAAHRSTFEPAISTSYRGIEVHEIGPSGQGIAALIALNLLEGYDLAGLEPDSPEYYHLMIEALRLASADSRRYVADPGFAAVPVRGLLSKAYAAERRKELRLDRAAADPGPGSPDGSSDTVYLCVVDGEGNACSFINSIYRSFGTGIVPTGTGFILQNRGSGFALDPAHPNVLAPGKRPYHTIIPALATRDGELWAAFGVMGGFMQPQGHVQLLSRMVDHGQEPQGALEAPRFCIDGGIPGGAVFLEDRLPAEVVRALEQRGHTIRIAPGVPKPVFGRGQIIRREPDSGVLWAGSDPRADGCAIGY